MINLLLVDDHEVVRRGLRELLESEEDLCVIAEASGLDGALALDLSGVNVAVLDVRLGASSGIDLCRQLRDFFPKINALMLTSYADDDAITASYLAGARGFVLKTLQGNDLLTSIRRVATGETILTLSQIDHAKARLAHQVAEDTALASLSPQEHHILGLLAEGLTNREIAGAMFLSEKTVKNYVSNILTKLGFAHRTEAALFAQRHLERTHPTD